MGARGGFFWIVASRVPRPAAAEPVVWVPRAALREENGSRYVWVVADGTVQRRDVQIGTRQGDRLRVLDGLVANERVVVGLDEAAFAGLRDGAKIAADY